MALIYFYILFYQQKS